MRKIQGFKLSDGRQTIVAKAMWNGRRKTVIHSDVHRDDVKATIAKAVEETGPDQSPTETT